MTRLSRAGRGAALALAVLAAVFPVRGASTGSWTLRIDGEHSSVVFQLGATFHTVHGTVTVTGGEIHFNPEGGQATGRVVADATSTTTHNAKRDRAMHKKVLESGTYPDFVFTPTRILGRLPEAGENDLEVEGRMAIHGGQHPMKVTVHVRREGLHLHGTASLTIPYVAWGMKNPSAAFLRVHKEVEVSIEMEGTVVPPEP
ncbi:MAG: YceI family protein [Acidobacteriota bacterium]